MVVGVPADFESRGWKLSNGAKILLEDQLWRFSGLLALYDQTNVNPYLWDNKAGKNSEK